MNYKEQQEAAFKKHQEGSPYTYSDLERLIWINGYSRCQLDRSEKELKELREQPGGSREDGLQVSVDLIEELNEPGKACKMTKELNNEKGAL